ncbi:hypothetical protein DZC72_14430 [Maribacter algicola]|uniref:Uncharacterized protein n=1 Tax=Maribacter algicola TaxID=2498892 RepID=A0A3R8R2Q8_9FLAO|nr:hypothetical protein DZC72_14430 [Maribacter algicola]
MINVGSWKNINAIIFIFIRKFADLYGILEVQMSYPAFECNHCSRWFRNKLTTLKVAYSIVAKMSFLLNVYNKGYYLAVLNPEKIS